MGEQGRGFRTGAVGGGAGVTDRAVDTESADEDVRSRTERGLAQFIGKNMVARLTGLLTNLVLARLLTPHDFGTVAVALSIVNIAVFFLDSGLAAAAIRHPELPGADVLRGFVGLQLVATSILCIVCIGGAALFSASSWYLVVALLVLPFLSLSTPAVVVANRDLQFRKLATADFAGALSGQVVSVGLAAVGFGPWALVIGGVARPIADLAVVSRGVDHRLQIPSLSLKPVVPLLRSALSFQLLPASSVINQQGVTLIAAALVTPQALGLWSFAGRLLAIPSAVYDILWRVAYPTMAAVLRKGQPDLGQVRRAIARVAMASAWMLGSLSILAYLFVVPVFGSAWRDAVPSLIAASVGLLMVTAVSTPALALLMMQGGVAMPVLAVIANAIVSWAVIVLASTEQALAIGLGTASGGIAESCVLLVALQRQGVPAGSVLFDLGRALLVAGPSVASAIAISHTVGRSAVGNTGAVIVGLGLIATLTALVARPECRYFLSAARRLSASRAESLSRRGAGET